MNRNFLPVPDDFRARLFQLLSELPQLLLQKQHLLVRAGMLFLCVATLWSKDVSVQLHFNDQNTALFASDLSQAEQAKAMNVSLLSEDSDGEGDPNAGNTFENTTYKNSKDRAAKRKRQEAYVKRFSKVAVAEMDKYGIPASITLAQALIESDCGSSRLAKENNNHFGIKCFSKKCRRGHCSNFTDDSHKDFFRKYKTNWESYRAHSKLLQKKRYKSLYKLSKSDYKAWSHGLRKAGYATDPRYGEKLIALIEALNLTRFD